MTTKQAERNKWVDEFVRKNERLPSHKEVMKKFKFSSTACSFKVLRDYKNSLIKCPLCNSRKKN